MTASTEQDARSKAHDSKLSRLGPRYTSPPPVSHDNSASHGVSPYKINTQSATRGVEPDGHADMEDRDDESASDTISESSESSQDDSSSDSSGEYLDAQTMAQLLAAQSTSQISASDSSASDLILPGVSDRPLVSTFRTQRQAPSALRDRLAAFLPEMAAANAELEALKQGGGLSDKVIDDYKSDDEADGGQYIEMDLGLGVLEERNETHSANDQEKEERDNDGHVMDNLMGRRRNSDDQSADEKLKPGIEEV